MDTGWHTAALIMVSGIFGYGTKTAVCHVASPTCRAIRFSRHGRATQKPCFMAPTAAEAYGLLPSLAEGSCPDEIGKKGRESFLSGFGKRSLVRQECEFLDRLIQIAILKLKRWNAGKFLQNPFVLRANLSSRIKLLAHALSRGALRQRYQ